MRRFVCVSSLCLLTACVVGPEYQPPSMSVPQTWQNGVSSTESTIPDEWWQAFHDEDLNRLVNDALVANLDLKQAILRVAQARILRKETIASGLPSLSAKNLATQRFNNSSAGGGGISVNGQPINIFQLGFDAQWELDFFGGIQRAVEAADASIGIEIENSRDARLTLVGEVVKAYLIVRQNQTVQKTYQLMLASQNEGLMLLDSRARSGFATALELSQAKTQYENTRANLPYYDTEIKKGIHALGVLLGREPTALTTLLLTTQPSVPAVAEPFKLALPSELLQRRPDIRRAERQMALANASVGIATAALYPKIDLAGFIGFQNLKITDFTPIGKSWSTASTVTLPLFNWGKLQANIADKDLQYQAAFLAYQSTVLTAFQEVENALVTLGHLQQRQHSLRQAVAFSEDALQLTQKRYASGLTHFMDVLQAQQTLYQVQIQQIESMSAVAQSNVALFKALGGGYVQMPAE